MQLIKQRIELPPLIGVTEEAEERRNYLALLARERDKVTCATEQLAAVAVGQAIRTQIKMTRQAGLELRKPVSNLAAQIKLVEDDYVLPLEEALEKLERLVTGFQIAEERRVQEEERKRSEEIARLEADRLAKEQSAREAAGRVKTERQLEKAIQKEVAAKEADKAVQVVIRAPLPEVNKARGAATRRVMRWEVTDIWALAAARPDLVKIEPKASAIQAVCVPELPVPGLKLWWEHLTIIRSS